VWKGLTSIEVPVYSYRYNVKQTYKIPANESYSNELNATNLRGYYRDEIYPFEIVFLLENGKQTDGFHIPGRIAGLRENSKLILI
jgi:hypothetical protein